ncbi:GTP cyclohydrolase I [Maribacter orientalis]|uniref:GTP cyclohydrolase 1 n=2 Tax=Maribacter orientalis TaxID=228957 RepID=A0A1H7UGW1_9FLAO|nr:GTP cyclohydrolase I [Maribacter orientalis]|tara:strand:- start:1166 stop:1837 length:672 start_codon:yes stop_codon:yes gene_type:complete
MLLIKENINFVEDNYEYIKHKIKSMSPYRNLEEYNLEITDEVKSRYSSIIAEIGEDVGREGLVKTPERAAKAMLFLTQGYQQDAVEILKGAMFKESYDEMVIIKDIELYSLCEHHMLPFFGKAHIAYIPNGHIVGLSKIPRVVDVFARRLQVQERLTHDILECINNTLKPKGVAVVIEASHMCMMMRGVQKQNSVTTTSGFRGQFEKIETRNEFLKLISSKLS